MEKTKTLAGTWKKSLELLLKQLTNELGGRPRVAVVGVGNLLRSDDAAGMLAVRSLSQADVITSRDRLLLREAGHAPENRTAELRHFAPDLVLFIDAAEMDEKPGTVRWISEEDMDGMSASTHSMPLSMLSRYLTLELDCKVILLGIQPASNEVGEIVSAEVSAAMDEIVSGLTESIETWI